MAGIRIIKGTWRAMRGRTRVGRELKSTGIYGRRVSGSPDKRAVRERGRR